MSQGPIAAKFSKDCMTIESHIILKLAEVNLDFQEFCFKLLLKLMIIKGKHNDAKHVRFNIQAPLFHSLNTCT